jgi:hypothetical protein
MSRENTIRLANFHRAVSWGDSGTKVHATDEDGKTMCGITIPDEEERGWYGDSGPVYGIAGCKRCREMMKGTESIEYHDAGPDSCGRRRFTLHWTDRDTKRMRGQCFHCDPARFAHLQETTT